MTKMTCVVLTCLILAVAGTAAAVLQKADPTVVDDGGAKMPLGFEAFGGATTKAVSGTSRIVHERRVSCPKVPEPSVPTQVPAWARGKAVGRLRGEGFREVGNRVGAFVSGRQMVIKTCLATSLEAAVYHTRPTGRNRDPHWDIYIDCDASRQWYIKVSDTIRFGDVWTALHGYYRLMAPHQNVHLDGMGRRRIMEVLPNAEVVVYGITFVNGRVQNSSKVLDKSQTQSGGWNGAGILVWYRGALTAYKCSFARNHASSLFARWGSGGAIKGESSSYVMVWGCTFTDNKAAGGGAIATSSATVLYVRASTFLRNQALGGMDGSEVNKGRKKNLILSRGGAIRSDSVSSHASHNEHILICNSDFVRNQVIFTLNDLVNKYDYSQNDLSYVRAAGAAVTLWNTPGNLHERYSKNFATVDGCLFENNEERVNPRGRRLGRYVLELEGAGHLRLLNSVFRRNSVEQAVAKLDNSSQWRGGQIYQTVMTNVDFVQNGATHNLEVETNEYRSRCTIRNVSGIRDGTGDCNDLVMGAQDNGGNRSEPSGDGFDW